MRLTQHALGLHNATTGVVDVTLQVIELVLSLENASVHTELCSRVSEKLAFESNLF